MTQNWNMFVERTGNSFISSQWFSIIYRHCSYAPGLSYEWFGGQIWHNIEICSQREFKILHISSRWWSKPQWSWMRPVMFNYTVRLSVKLPFDNYRKLRSKGELPQELNFSIHEICYFVSAVTPRFVIVFLRKRKRRSSSRFFRSTCTKIRSTNLKWFVLLSWRHKLHMSNKIRWHIFLMKYLLSGRLSCQ